MREEENAPSEAPLSADPRTSESHTGFVANVLSLWQAARARKVAQWGVGYLVAAFGLLQGTQLVADTLDWSPLVARVVLVVLGAGFPIALIIAWSHGERGRQRITVTETALIAACVVSGVALAGFVVLEGAAVPGGVTASRSGDVRTAVLSFTAPAGNEALRTFADGLVNDITDVTTQIGIPTLARDQSSDVHGAEGLGRAAQRGATFVLGGDVRQEGDLLIAAVRLDDPRTGTMLWSGQFEQSAARARDLRQQAATQAVYVVECAHDARHSRGGNISATSLAEYLRACTLWRSVQKPVEVYNILARLTLKEPKFANAFGALAFTAANLAYAANTSDERRKSLLEEARAAAKRAIELDPRSGTPYVAQALLVGDRVSSWREYERWLNDGLRRDPGHSNLNCLYGNFLRKSGAIRDATAYLERCVAGDPLSPSKSGYLAWALFLDGRESEARRVLDGMAPKWPNSDVLRNYQVRFALFTGDPDEIARLLDAAPSDEDEGCARMAAEAIADPQRAHRVRTAVDCITRHSEDPWIAVEILSALGKVDQAYAVIANNIDDPGLYPGSFFVPATALLRRDPRFMPLMQRLGLLDYWRATGRWPDFCNERDLPFACNALAARLPTQQ